MGFSGGGGGGGGGISSSKSCDDDGDLHCQLVMSVMSHMYGPCQPMGE